MSNLSYYEKAKPVWDELSMLLDKARARGPQGLTAEELARLDRLYRLSVIHLAQIRLRTTNQGLLERLNRLVARAHSFIYVSPRRNPLRTILEFYTVGFARAVVRTWKYQLAAALLMVVAAILTHHAAMEHELPAYAFLAGDVRLPGSTPEQLEAVLRSGRDQDVDEKLFFASFLLTHNTKVGFTAFALGVLAGIPTVFLILTNGAMLGAFSAIHYRKGIVAEMWAWLLPHGVTELSAIVLCGGAGLMLGMAILRPGFTTRGHSLLMAGREAIRIVMGVIPMFILAGIIESFARQSHMTTAERLTFAAATGVFWVLYFGLGALIERRESNARDAG